MRKLKKQGNVWLPRRRKECASEFKTLAHYVIPRKKFWACKKVWHYQMKWEALGVGQWSHFCKQRSSWWIDFDPHESNIFDLTGDLHRGPLSLFCWPPPDKVKESWNSQWIRKSRNATVSSILDMMYFLPKEFGQNDCLIPVSSDKLIDMEIYLYWSRENWPRFCRVCSIRQRKHWFNLSKDYPWRRCSFWETNNICYGPFADWLSYY